MGFCIAGVIGDCGNKQETKTTTEVRNTLVTDIQKEMNTKFSNIYSTKTSVGCEQAASQSITAGNIVARGSRGFTMQNNLNLTLDCALQKTSAKDLRS
jgi:hypothetical protein